ncbi:serine hydrolase [Nocardia sp. NPDC127579]|uniref:serine hydrolase n=1 Tax=Nocardia sp. NPDC127579 TaxID=3345402 RepID=UPI003640CEAA
MSTEAIQRLFDEIPVRGTLHALDLADGRQVELGADEQVVIASIFKILLVLEFCRQVDAGQLDPAERVLIRAADRLGGWGTAGCADDIEVSLRDLAYFAMSVSDNTAADLLLHRIGRDTPALLAAELGLDRTRVIGGPRQLLESMLADVGARDGGEFAAIYPTLTAEQVADMRVFQPEHTTSSTAREITRLLAMIWQDTAGTPAACAATRNLLRHQIFWTRIAAGFPDEVRVASKTGTLPGLHMEAGVVEYPDGGRYALALFARSGELGSRRLDIDLAMSRAARLAVDALRLSPPRRSGPGLRRDTVRPTVP